MPHTLFAAVLGTEIESYAADYLKIIDALPEADLWRTADGLPNSVGTLARHLTGNLNFFFGNLLLHTDYVRVREQEFAERVPKAQVMADLQAAAQTAHQALDTLDDETLAKPFTAPNGTAYESLAHLLGHMTLHFATHYGQADYAQHFLKTLPAPNKPKTPRTIGEPKIDTRPEQIYMGIRTQTPFKGMFKVINKLFSDMRKWMAKHEVTATGAPFLRYHVINMNGDMDIEVGFPVAKALPNDGKVSSGVLPGGRYASLIYSGSGLAGNGALIDWAIANGLTWDRWDDPKGDGFRSRYEAYLTDPKVEPRKTRWQVEVAIKLADSP